jgi:hypothetical protein
MSDEKMRGRLRKFFDLVPTGELASNFGEKDMVAFAEHVAAEAAYAEQGESARVIGELRSEVEGLRAALAPRDPSPELSEPEVQLRGQDWDGCVFLDGKERKVIAVELDRLRSHLSAALDSEIGLQAEVKRLQGLIRTAAQVGQQAAGGKATFSFYEWMQKVDELCDVLKSPHPAPEQDADRATRVQWQIDTSAEDAVTNDESCLLVDEDDAHEQCGDDEHVCRVTITAERVSRKEGP